MKAFTTLGLPRHACILMLAGGATMPVGVVSATDYTVAAGATQALSTDLGGGDTLTKQGAGALQVTVDQTFTGDITLNDGTLILYGNAAGATIVNGGLLMMGGTTGQPIALNGGTLRIGSQRSIPFTSASNSRGWIGYGGTNAQFNFGSGATFYTQSRATNQSQTQDIINAGLPDDGLVTSLADPAVVFQMNVNSAVSGSRVDSESGSNTRFISIPAGSQAKFVEVQALLGHSTTAASTMGFLGYARYSDAPTSNVYSGATGNTIPQYTAATGTPAVSVGRVNRDTNAFSTTPIALYQHAFQTDPEKTMVQMGMVRSGANSNQGGYFALAGLAVNDASTAFTSDITVSGNVTIDLSGAAISGGAATLTGQAVNLAGGTLTLTRSLGAARDYAATFTGGAVSATTNLVVNSPGAVTISGPLTGAGSITKTGDGVLILSGTNSFGSGTLTFGGGTSNVGYLRATDDNAFGSHTTVALASDQAGVSGIQVEGGVSISQALTTEGRNNQTTTGYILRNLSGNNAWNGTITIVEPGGGYGFVSDAGTLTLGGGVTSSQTAFSTRRTVEFAGGGDFAVTGNVIKGGTASLGQDMNLSKSGAGTLTLSGTNDYGGTTTVSVGRLLVNGDSNFATGAITVNGGTLGGTGSVGGTVTVNAGGTLAPGASIESFATGSASLVDGSFFDYEIDSSAAVSVGADLLLVDGGFDLAGTVALSLTDVAGTPAVVTPGTIFALVNYTGAWNTGTFSFGGTPLADGDTFTAGLNDWRIDYASGSGGVNFSADYTAGSFVTITAVPEPAIPLCGCVVTAVAARCFGRRRETAARPVRIP